MPRPVKRVRRTRAHPLRRSKLNDRNRRSGDLSGRMWHTRTPAERRIIDRLPYTQQAAAVDSNLYFKDFERYWKERRRRVVALNIVLGLHQTLARIRRKK